MQSSSEHIKIICEVLLIHIQETWIIIGADTKKGSILTILVAFLPRRYLKNNLFTLAKSLGRNKIIESQNGLS